MRKSGTLLVLGLMMAACARGGSPTSQANTTSGTAVSGAVSDTGGIIGWVWDDVCDSGKAPASPSATLPPGCVSDPSAPAPIHGDGVPSNGHAGIIGVAVDLGVGKCPSPNIAQTITSPSDYSFEFADLRPGTYCVSIDPKSPSNAKVLGEGIWTAPDVGDGVVGVTVTIGPGEFRSGVEFGWDFRSKP